MICVCGHDVTVHAKVYDGVLYQEGWFSADGEGRFLGRSARPFTLSGECRAVTDMGNHRLSCPCPRFVRALVPGPVPWIASCGSVYCTSKLMVLDVAGREEAALLAAGWAPVDRRLHRGPWLCSACQKRRRERQDIRGLRFGALQPGTVADCPTVAVPHPSVGNPAEAEWWKKYDRPPCPGRPEVM